MKSFTSLGPFIREAAKTNPDQADILFKKFGQEALKIRTKQPRTFLSTAGMGISWLHLRLDNRPKYYVSEYGFNNWILGVKWTVNALNVADPWPFLLFIWPVFEISA